MVGKFIECEVPPSKKEQFSNAQEAWSGTISSRGFNGQVGGWSAQGTTAFIFAIWEDMESLDLFMASRHDSISAKSQQTGTFNRITVSLMKEVMAIPSFVNSVARIGSEIGFVRVSDCRMRPTVDDKFIQEQMPIWSPETADHKGTLGGFVWQSISDPRRYLTTSFWGSEEHHKAYIKDLPARISTNSDIRGHIASISEHLFITEPNWTVMPRPMDDAGQTRGQS